MSVDVTLPWPPSVNTYWRHPNKGALAGRHLISDKGRKYRAIVKWECYDIEQVTGRVGVTIIAHPPDNRRRDLDNILKGVLDGLTHAGVIEDDSMIDALLVVRAEVTAGGCVHVNVKPMEVV